MDQRAAWSWIVASVLKLPLPRSPLSIWLLWAGVMVARAAASEIWSSPTKPLPASDAALAGFASAIAGGVPSSVASESQNAC